MLTRTLALICLAVCLSAGNLMAQDSSNLSKPPLHLPTVNMHGVLTTGTYQPALGSFDETILYNSPESTEWKKRTKLRGVAIL